MNVNYLFTRGINTINVKIVTLNLEKRFVEFNFILKM